MLPGTQTECMVGLGGGSAPDASVCDETLKWVSVLTDKRLQLVNLQAPLD